MTFVYIVRCNFTAPDREQAWNDWYSGPKIAQMLRNPMFLSCQRFRRVSGEGRGYLALWTMEGPEALRTPDYLSQWGFSEWTPLIVDWSRDLFDGGAAEAQSFAVPRNGALRVIAFDGMSEPDARRERDALATPEQQMRWLPIAGLDRHTPLIGLQVLAGPPRADAAAGAIYRPISDFHRA
ncbi:MAG: hypothetical protein FJX62_16860 [Alphaproteobacteria bacterium]|nr:hypothetical protein [Alphaproteobacteria bacterium]